MPGTHFSTFGHSGFTGEEIEAYDAGKQEDGEDQGVCHTNPEPDRLHYSVLPVLFGDLSSGPRWQHDRYFDRRHAHTLHLLVPHRFTRCRLDPPGRFAAHHGSAIISANFLAPTTLSASVWCVSHSIHKPGATC